jgi:hypothetical protein
MGRLFDEIDHLERSVIESDTVIGIAIEPKHYSSQRLA